MSQHYDALILGGGHNGLVCAFYLARAGLRVRVLERRHLVGGAAVTEEFAPGFRNSTASYTVSLLQPKVIADMRLHQRGLRIVERRLSNFLPFDDDYLKLGGGMARTQAEFARFSVRDADAYPAYDAALEKGADVLRGLALEIPPNAGGGLGELVAAARQGWPLGTLDLAAQRDLLAIFTRSAREFLAFWFEDDRIKAAFAFDAVVGNWAAKGHEEIVAKLKAKYNEPWMTQNAISTYGDMWILKSALEKAAKADRQAVAEAIRSLDDGPSKYFPGGQMKFDEKGRRVGAGLAIIQWQSGIPVTVYPPESAMAQPIWPKK